MADTTRYDIDFVAPQLPLPPVHTMQMLLISLTTFLVFILLNWIMLYVRLLHPLKLKQQDGSLANGTQLQNAKVDLTATTATTLYTCPTATTAIVKSILVSEDSGNADTITVTLTDSASAVFSLFKTKAVSANTTVELLTAPLVVEESEVLKVTAATANRLHVTAKFFRG